MEKVGKIAIFHMISCIFADFTLWLSGASRIAPGGLYAKLYSTRKYMTQNTGLMIISEKGIGSNVHNFSIFHFVKLLKH